MQILTPHIPPAPWRPRPHLVAARWRRYWRGLQFAWAPWAPFENLVTGEAPSSDPLSWTSERYGWGRSGGVGDRVVYSQADRYQMSDGEGTTVFCVVDGAIASGVNEIFMSARDDATDGSWMFIVRPNNRLQIFYNDGGGFYNSSTPEVVVRDTDMVHYMGGGRERNNGDWAFWYNGTWYADDLGVTQPFGSSAHTFTLNDPNYVANLGTTAAFMVAYKWNRLLSPDEFALLERDPWGPLRPELVPWAVVGPALEGYRWRNDDGSESAATWKDAQDADISVAPGTDARLRMILDNPTAGPVTIQAAEDGTEDWFDLDVEP